MILESREVTKKYGSKTAVNQVSLQLEPGLVYAMLGPNGSGKTTWMKMVAGLVKPTNGEILYQGTPIGKESKKEIAYMSTEPYFYNWMTVSDVGKYYEDFFEDFSMEKYRQMISRMELTEDMKAKKLSSGMMAKLKIAVTMAREARLYLLDEPLNGIDLLDYEEHSGSHRSRCDTGSFQSSRRRTGTCSRCSHFYERWYFGKSVHGRGASDQSTQIRTGSIP